jgi:hypothetical protein
LIDRESTRQLKAEIAGFYVRRGVLMADLLQNLSRAQELGDYRALDERTKEHLKFEIVQLIANWDGAKVVGPDVNTDGDITRILSAIADLEDSICALESQLPAS